MANATDVDKLAENIYEDLENLGVNEMEKSMVITSLIEMLDKDELPKAMRSALQ